MKKKILPIIVFGLFLLLGLLSLPNSRGYNVAPRMQPRSTSIVENREHGGVSIFHQNETQGKLWLELFICITVFGGIDVWFWHKSKHKVDDICNDADLPNSKKLMGIKNEEVWFDLPLYAGLFGTVLGFILIAFGFNLRIVAYFSTLLGIFFSAGMRLWILRPARSKIISSLESKDE